MNGRDVMKSRGMDMTADSWDEDAFAKAGLSIIVTCAGCNMTMALPSVATIVGEHELCYCSDCAEQFDEEADVNLSAFTETWMMSDDVRAAEIARLARKLAGPSAVVDYYAARAAGGAR